MLHNFWLIVCEDSKQSSKILLPLRGGGYK